MCRLYCSTLFNIVQHCSTFTSMSLLEMISSRGKLLAIENSVIETNDRSNRILLVDDEQDITLAFTNGLKQSGFEVDAFNNPEEALSNFKPDYYGLLLLDVRMSKIDGFELSKRLERER